jgi:hypothetical protein
MNAFSLLRISLFGPVAGIAFLLLAGRPLAAEIEFPAASPLGRVSQVIGTTEVAVEYSRPSVKGRKVFGGLAPYGAVWRTGANASTKITFEHDVLFGGEPVPAGTYALYTIPDEEEWTFIISGKTELWGASGYDESGDIVRVAAKPVELPFTVETFTVGFDKLRDDSAIFYLDWENTRVAVTIETTDEARIMKAITETMPPVAEANLGLLYNAARYYREHEGDLEQAQIWIDAAAEKRPNAYWIQFEKARIAAARGDAEAARKAAEASLQSAEDQGADAGMLFAIRELIEAL